MNHGIMAASGPFLHCSPLDSQSLRDSMADESSHGGAWNSIAAISHDWLAQDYQWDPYRLIASRSSLGTQGGAPAHANGESGPARVPIIGAMPAAWENRLSLPMEGMEGGGHFGAAEPTIISNAKRAYDRSLPLTCQVRVGVACFEKLAPAPADSACSPFAAQVNGCGLDLTGTKPYYRRYRVW